MRVRYTLLLLLLMPFFSLFAQNPQFSFFSWAQPYFNPAAIGEKENHLNFIGFYRESPMRDSVPTNTGERAPGDAESNRNFIQNGQREVLLHIDSYIKKIKGGIGITFLSDKDGRTDKAGFSIGYAQKFRIRNGKLGVGVQLGFLNQAPPKISDFIANDNPNNDPTLHGLNSTESFLDFDMNFGLNYRTPTWYVGLSGTNLTGGGVRISGAEISSLRVGRQYYLTGGYILNLRTVVPWAIEPNVLINTSNFAIWRINVMALARYNGILWFGLSYQHNNAIVVLLGATPFYNSTNDYLRGLELGFAYGFDTKKSAYVKGGTWGDFEIVFRYGFNFYKEKTLTGYGSSRHLYKNQY
ncbi:MAG: type IX secretion system membrane protein PorP/SprF [Bacteroidales bacterium]|jgi:type IX secretion system PorP/SprF family membrane protein|nr:type IX secretion system membrane protein PorP/SprF [Bacteroidales bacterium]